MKVFKLIKSSKDIRYIAGSTHFRLQQYYQELTPMMFQTLIFLMLWEISIMKCFELNGHQPNNY